MMRRASFLFFVSLIALEVRAGDWVRPGINTNQPVWGLRGGLLWAVAPAGFRHAEPRGLIRLGYPVRPDGGYDLINFIAIEPIVQGRRAFSELEQSHLDGVAGKRIWARGEPQDGSTNLVSGRLRKGAQGEEELDITLGLEKFDNGAHVRLEMRQSSTRPDEVELRVFREADSAPLEDCVLTATMGNMTRTRQLWLKDQVVSSLEVYRDYRQTGFAPHAEYPLARLQRTVDGGVLVAVSNDEENPALVYPFARSEAWHYAGSKVTQYWAKERGTFTDDLKVVVNGRYTYWRSAQPIPGGIAFENFELREPFLDGQRCVFGITRRTPRELGFGK